MKGSNGTFEEFEQQLRDALTQLYHPGYRPPGLLLAKLAVNPQDRPEAVRESLIQVIEALKPAPGTPPGARGWRFYSVLAHRYVEARTQEQTAELLGITPRHLRREQQEAIQVLARRLWEQPLAGDEVAAWRSQVQQELDALQKSAPGAAADVTEAIEGAVMVGQALAARHGVELLSSPGEPGLLVTLHPSALRQVVVTAIEKLAQGMTHGQIRLSAARMGGEIQLTATAEPAPAGPLPGSDFIREILAAHGGAVTATLRASRASFQVNLPAITPLTVLVVDDNHDLVHFYRRFVANTRYRIVHATEGESVFAIIEQERPAVIILDVMLPDMDGWELLAALRGHPRTQSLPVIVCSVVRREELAETLQAARCLAKPVRRQQLLQALDQVLGPAPTAASTIPVYSSTDG
ncbi:MAG: response regulator [Caldilineaceae bacterium]|nr:response regulator [Caldilineaceae bacterium]